MGVAGSCQGCSCFDSSDEIIPFRGTGGEIRVLIVALNYEYCPGYELAATRDAEVMFRIMSLAHVDDVTVHDKHLGTPDFPTRQTVLRHIKEVGSRCEPGDWFIWFFAGHGVNVVDISGDEEDGMDEAFVTPTDSGQLEIQALLIDDDFAHALNSYIPQGVRILCINDCCHSGTICDIDSYMYTHEIYAIASTQDYEEALDTGKGGVLTLALKSTIQALSLRYGDNEFSIQDVFDGCQRRARKISEEQELQFQFSGTSPDIQAWPLCFPWWEYLHKHSHHKLDTRDKLDTESDDDS